MITLEELLNRYQAGERNFSQIQIRLSELVNQNLSEIELNERSPENFNNEICIEQLK